MAEEETISQETAEEATSEPAKGKSDLMMYLIVGVGALVITVGAMVAMGDMSGSASDADESEYAEEDDSDAGSGHSVDDDSSDEEELELPDIFSELDNLDFLNDTNFAEAGEKADDHKTLLKDNKTPEQMSKEDSLAAMSWIDAEKARLTTREKEVAAKEKKLSAQEHEVDQKLKKLDQVEANRLNGLAKLYDGMKHDQVARMIVKLQDETIVQILPRMKTANAAKILGLLPSDRGARISKKMITLSSK